MFAGWQGFAPCCSYPWSAGGGSLCHCSCCCSQLFTHASGPCSESQSLPGRCQVHKMCFSTAPSSSILSSHRSSRPPLSLSIVLHQLVPHSLLFFFFFFVSAFSLFAYNSCLSYFLPVSSNNISLPPAPSLSFISRLLSILLPPCPSDPALHPCSGCVFLLYAL